MNVKLLKNRDFALLLGGQYISASGSIMQSFALSLYVLSITKSGGIFASVLAVSILPSLILTPISGVFVDRFDRKKIIVGLDLLSGIIAVAFYVLSITAGLKLLYIYIGVIVFSAITSIFTPAINTAIPSIMKKEELVEANALSSMIMSTAGIISPILAGALYGTLGLSIILLLNALSFFCASFMELFIKLPQLERKTTKFTFTVFKKDLAEGVIFLVNHKLLRKILICAFVINFTFNPMMSVGFVYLAKMVLKVEDVQLGMQQTILVVGTLIGPLMAGKILKKLELTKVFYMGLFLLGGLITLIALDTSKWFLQLFVHKIMPFAFMILIGMLIVAISGIINISITTMKQSETPLELYGRVNSVQIMLAMSAVPLGQMIFGLLLDSFPHYIVILFTSSSMVVTAFLFRYSIISENKKRIESQRKEEMIETDSAVSNEYR